MRFTNNGRNVGSKAAVGNRGLCSTSNGFVLELYPLKPGAAVSNVRLGFEVDSVDAVTDRLERLGTVCVEQPHVPEEAAQGRRAVVKDFDGNAVEVTE